MEVLYVDCRETGSGGPRRREGARAGTAHQG